MVAYKTGTVTGQNSIARQGLNSFYSNIHSSDNSYITDWERHAAWDEEKALRHLLIASTDKLWKTAKPQEQIEKFSPDFHSTLLKLQIQTKENYDAVYTIGGRDYQEFQKAGDKTRQVYIHQAFIPQEDGSITVREITQTMIKDFAIKGEAPDDHNTKRYSRFAVKLIDVQETTIHWQSLEHIIQTGKEIEANIAGLSALQAYMRNPEDMKGYLAQCHVNQQDIDAFMEGLSADNDTATLNTEEKTLQWKRLSDQWVPQFMPDGKGSFTSVAVRLNDQQQPEMIFATAVNRTVDITRNSDISVGSTKMGFQDSDIQSTVSIGNPDYIQVQLFSEALKSMHQLFATSPASSESIKEQITMVWQVAIQPYLQKPGFIRDPAVQQELSRILLEDHAQCQPMQSVLQGYHADFQKAITDSTMRIILPVLVGIIGVVVAVAAVFAPPLVTGVIVATAMGMGVSAKIYERIALSQVPVSPPPVNNQVAGADVKPNQDYQPLNRDDPDKQRSMTNQPPNKFGPSSP